MPLRGFNVGVWRAELESKDIIRPNNFLVAFEIPIGLFGGDNFTRNTETVRVMEYWCQGASMPGMAFASWQCSRYGYGATEKRPMMGVFTDVTFKLVDDGNGDNFAFFHQWQNMIHNNDARNGPLTNSTNVTTLGPTLAASLIPAAPYELSYAEEYKTDVRIFIYDQVGNIVKCAVLRQAWPIAVGEIGVHWAEDNAYSILPVSMAYTDWYNDENPPA